MCQKKSVNPSIVVSAFSESKIFAYVYGDELENEQTTHFPAILSKFTALIFLVCPKDGHIT